jgi:hypothetical protein
MVIIDLNFMKQDSFESVFGCVLHRNKKLALTKKDISPNNYYQKKSVMVLKYIVHFIAQLSLA